MIRRITRCWGQLRWLVANWQAYRLSHCNSVYMQWRDGSIRGVMAFSCKTQLTKQRSHDIWKNFLSYMDGTPAILPEPDTSL
ncbi:lysozyme inhibitor LprI family protein [Alishewanella jeotgali]|uniref:lysozyme inhibitor LprI family protein n=1 Tax=Alishewanella jeotgali TaxID=545533 RepID=UPI0009FF31B7|nr:lysozyme inhibitor LprI family protein [Alishewanella jeotgali]